MRHPSAGRTIAARIISTGKAARALAAKSAYLIAFLFLLAASALLVLAVRDRRTATRNSESIVVVGISQHSASAHPPVFVIEQLDDGKWQALIRMIALPGQMMEFVLSTGMFRFTPAGSKETSDCTASIAFGEEDAAWQSPINRLPVIHYAIGGQPAMVQAVSGRELTRPYEHYRVFVPAVLQAGDNSTHLIELTLKCQIHVIPMRDGWSSRSVVVWSAEESAHKGVDVDLSLLSNLASFSVSGGGSSDAGPPEFRRNVKRYREEMTARWIDEDAAWLRDVVLLGIGACLGIAGACLIEWARPWFERMARHRS